MGPYLLPEWMKHPSKVMREERSKAKSNEKNVHGSGILVVAYAFSLHSGIHGSFILDIQSIVGG